MFSNLIAHTIIFKVLTFVWVQQERVLSFRPRSAVSLAPPAPYHSPPCAVSLAPGAVSLIPWRRASCLQHVFCFQCLLVACFSPRCLMVPPGAAGGVFSATSAWCLLVPCFLPLSSSSSFSWSPRQLQIQIFRITCSENQANLKVEDFLGGHVFGHLQNKIFRIICRQGSSKLAIRSHFLGRFLGH